MNPNEIEQFCSYLAKHTASVYTGLTEDERVQAIKEGRAIRAFVDINNSNYHYATVILQGANDAFMSACNIAITGIINGQDRDIFELLADPSALASVKDRESARELTELYSTTYGLKVCEYELQKDPPLYVNDSFMEQYASTVDELKACAGGRGRLRPLRFEVSLLESAAFELAFIREGGFFEDMSKDEQEAYRLNLQFTLLDKLHRLIHSAQDHLNKNLNQPTERK